VYKRQVSWSGRAELTQSWDELPVIKVSRGLRTHPKAQHSTAYG